MLERIQKIIARSTGVSRRQAEELIRLGKVYVNGHKADVLGMKVDQNLARISVLGRRVLPPSHFQYLLLNKPKGCVVTRHDPLGRKTVYHYLPRSFHHLKPVGRLDYNSQGLLLLTDDGALSQQLTHPRFHFSKVYEVKVSPHPSARQMARLEKGFLLDGRLTQPLSIQVIEKNAKSTWLKMTLKEGRNRQIHRMCDKVGLTVKVLVRVSFGSLNLKGIPSGKWCLLKEKPKFF